MKHPLLRGELPTYEDIEAYRISELLVPTSLVEKIRQWRAIKKRFPGTKFLVVWDFLNMNDTLIRYLIVISMSVLFGWILFNVLKKFIS